jgi:phage terminase small subunit
MGIRGRKPNLEAQASGASHKAEIVTDFLPLPVESADPALLPEEYQPDTESMTPDGVAIWNMIVPDLVEAQVFREMDTILLEELCESLSMAREFRKQMIYYKDRLGSAMLEAEGTEDDPLMDSYSRGLKRARSGYREMMQTAMSIAGEFGISPVARMRLGLLKIQGNSLLGALKDL